jgi:hypothetical protein
MFRPLVFRTGLQRQRTRRGRPGVLPWRAAHNATEGLAEGTLRLVAERLRDGEEAFRGVLQAVGSQKHAPAGEVLHGGGADDLAEAQGEDRARHANAFGQRLQRPGISRGFVDAGNGDAHMLVRQRRKPAVTSAGAVGQVQAQRLDEHRVGELLRYQRTAGLGIAELFTQALERPAHGSLVRLAADVDDGRQRVQEHLGVAACEPEEASGDVPRAFGDRRDVIGLAEATPRERVSGSVRARDPW